VREKKLLHQRATGTRAESARKGKRGKEEKVTDGEVMLQLGMIKGNAEYKKNLPAVHLRRGWGVF